MLKILRLLCHSGEKPSWCHSPLIALPRGPQGQGRNEDIDDDSDDGGDVNDDHHYHDVDIDDLPPQYWQQPLGASRPGGWWDERDSQPLI